MATNPNTVGGGAQTNVNGLHFEQTTELKEAIEATNEYTIQGNDVLKDGNLIAKLLQKHDIYRYLKDQDINYKDYLSKKLLPDDAILVGNNLFIIEKKFQSSPGSVDEKLQTCDFKKKQYSKLFAPLDISVAYIYLLNDWFQQNSYEDTRNYIISMGCSYYFNNIPLTAINL